MKRALLRIVGKSILAVSPLLWKCPSKIAFDLHQKLGNIAVNLHHKHNLNLWDDNE